MTNPSLVTSGPTTQILDAIRLSFAYASQLVLVATQAITAFTWLRERRRRYVPLLDFDVISGALPRLALFARGQEEGRYAESVVLGEYSGSATLQYLLQNIDELVVPPGTAAEIISRNQELTHSISDRAEQFLQRLYASFQRQASIEALAAGTEHVDVLLADLDDIVHHHRDRSLLTLLLQRSFTPQEYPGVKVDDRATLSVLNACHNYLQHERPQRSHNNFHDAFNAAYVARLFNASEASQHVPLLISQTRAVLNLQERFAHSFGPHVLPPLFADKAFLIVTQGILKRTDQCYGPAIDEAKLLSQDATRLRDSCSILLQHCNESIARNIPGSELTVSSLPDADWSMLLYHRDLFARQWGSMLAPVQMVQQRDRLAYLELLGTKDWAKELKVSDQDAFKRRLYQFYVKLKESRPADYEIWNLIMNRRALREEALTSAEPQLFNLVIRENDGTLLGKIERGLPIGELSNRVLAGSHEIQLAAIPRLVSAGAILTICSLLDHDVSPRRWLRLTWVHRCNRNQAAQTCIDLLRSVSTDWSDRSLTALFLSSTEHQTLQDADAKILDRVMTTWDLETLQIAMPDARTFADIVPLQGEECQMGLTVATDRWSPQLQEAITRHLVETSNVTLEAGYAAKLLDDCLAAIGPGRDSRDRLS